jgi:hypothetical protein
MRAIANAALSALEFLLLLVLVGCLAMLSPLATAVRPRRAR